MSTVNLNESFGDPSPFETRVSKVIEITENPDPFQDLAENLKTQMVLHELDRYFKSNPILTIVHLLIYF